MVESVQEDNHFTVIGEAKKFDTAEDVEKAFIQASGADKVDLSTVTRITLGGNSYGFEACEWLANLLKD
jgi:Ran GTPase-activating protein (RanGAP) involved in mRNA processing and transport